MAICRTPGDSIRPRGNPASRFGSDLFFTQAHLAAFECSLPLSACSGAHLDCLYILTVELKLNFWQAPSGLIDSYFYGKMVFVPLNIIRYNLFSTSGGPTLYGTEPWYFYILNGVLNFNVAFGLALVALPLLLLSSLLDKDRFVSSGPHTTSPRLLLAMRLLTFNIWFLVLSSQAHKEERFMFAAIGLLCFNAATAMYLIRGMVEKVIQQVAPSQTYVRSFHASLAKDLSFTCRLFTRFCQICLGPF